MKTLVVLMTVMLCCGSVLAQSPEPVTMNDLVTRLRVEYPRLQITLSNVSDDAMFGDVTYTGNLALRRKASARAHRLFDVMTNFNDTRSWRSVGERRRWWTSDRMIAKVNPESRNTVDCPSTTGRSGERAPMNRPNQ